MELSCSSFQLAIKNHLVKELKKSFKSYSKHLELSKIMNSFGEPQKCFFWNLHTSIMLHWMLHSPWPLPCLELAFILIPYQAFNPRKIFPNHCWDSNITKVKVARLAFTTTQMSFQSKANILVLHGSHLPRTLHVKSFTIFPNPFLA